ncbi:MAG TPA: hypothetical protein VGV07_19100 [Devosia sp.]|jgi:phosphonate transport system permease protein|uniref:PhnE/PtxC family ABC transporter permease n=1 Tax=Devosia sp. TaxID=1871048 RepID=UPI002DDD89A7|nr:hypothetical protein [Devosia sp.]HEV2517368.1 hypothetical protein [Devosia sp.]
MLLLIAMTAIIDLSCEAICRRLIGQDAGKGVLTMNAKLSADTVAVLRQTNPEILARPLPQRLRSWALWLAFLAVFGFGLWLDRCHPQRIWDGLGKLGFLVHFMWPPSDGGAFWEHVYAMPQTLGMAFLGTLIAAVVALPLGFLGAKNVVPNWLFHFGLRRGFDSNRVRIWPKRTPASRLVKGLL